MVGRLLKNQYKILKMYFLHFQFLWNNSVLFQIYNQSVFYNKNIASTALGILTALLISEEHTL